MRTRRVWLRPGVEPVAEPGWVIVRQRIIRREYRIVGYRSKRTGRRVSAAAVRRWPGKMAAVRRLVRVRWEVIERRKRKRKRPPPPPPPPPTEREQWEVTVSYRSADKDKVQDITVRMIARVPGPFTVEQVRGAFWVAHKHGPAALREWAVEGIDWRAGARDYHYPRPGVSLREALDNAAGIINTVGRDGLRVARVEA